MTSRRVRATRLSTAYAAMHAEIQAVSAMSGARSTAGRVEARAQGARPRIEECSYVKLDIGQGTGEKHAGVVVELERAKVPRHARALGRHERPRQTAGGGPHQAGLAVGRA